MKYREIKNPDGSTEIIDKNLTKKINQ